MNNVALNHGIDNIICMTEVIKSKKTPKLNKDGTVSKVHCNKQAGISSEVFSFKTKEEIDSMIKVFDRYINEAPDADKLRIARRNKLLFILGINLSLRASDLRTVKYSFFLHRTDDGKLKFNEYYSLIPQKQKKTRKFIKLFFNDVVKNAIINYIEYYPIDNIDSMVFASRKGKYNTEKGDDEAIKEQTIWRVLNNAAIEAGIKQNIGSHSLRKTFGYWTWHEAADKNKALVILQQLFAHSSTQVTMRYIGILDEEIKDTYYSISLGNEGVSFG